MKSKLKAVAGALGVVAVFSGLWLAARAGVSPEQRLADAEPPPAAVATGVLEERVLENTVVVRGRVSVQDQIPMSGPRTPADGVPVVVDLPVEVGQEVANGDVVAVVADRPVIVVEMPVPMWRGLQPGDKGADVRRFQQALAGLGYQVPEDGVFGPVTQQAVRRLYHERGFDPSEAIVEPADPSEQEAQPNEPVSGGERQPEQQKALAEEPEMGVTVPLGEVAGVPDLPASVSALPAALGNELGEGPVAVLSSSEYVIRAEVEPGRSALLTPGTVGVAEVDGENQSWEVEVVAADGKAADNDAVSPLGEEGAVGEPGPPISGESAEDVAAPPTAGDVLFVPAEPLGTDMLGRSARIEVTLESTESSVLAAPIAAISTDADGAYLRVDGEDGETLRVDIEPGASIGGWVELIDPDGLDPGVTVVLG